MLSDGRALRQGEAFEHLRHRVRLVGEELSPRGGVLLVDGVPPVFGEQFVEGKEKCRGVAAGGGEVGGQVDEVHLSLAAPHVHEPPQPLFPRGLVAFARALAPRAHLPLHLLQHKAPPRFVVFRFVVERGKGRLDLAEGGGNLKQPFADHRAVAVDALARQLPLAESAHPRRALVEQFFGQEREQQAGDERHEHGQVERRARKRPRGVFGIVKVGQVAHRHVREEHGEHGGQLARPQKGERQGGVQNVFRADDKLRRRRGYALADRGRQG